jgi:hypothetical protein
VKLAPTGLSFFLENARGDSRFLFGKIGQGGGSIAHAKGIETVAGWSMVEDPRAVR